MPVLRQAEQPRAAPIDLVDVLEGSHWECPFLELEVDQDADDRESNGGLPPRQF